MNVTNGVGNVSNGGNMRYSFLEQIIKKPERQIAVQVSNIGGNFKIYSAVVSEFLEALVGPPLKNCLISAAFA